MTRYENVFLGIFLAIIFFLNLNFLPSFIVFSFTSLFFCIINTAIIKRIGFINIKKNSYGEIKHPFIIFFIIIFIPMMIAYTAYYPGGFNLDALGQWDQVHFGFLNDWHPIMGTLIIYAVTRIYDSFSFFIFIQIMSFCLCVSYMYNKLYKYGINYKYLIISVIYIAISPATWSVMVCMYKDSLFAIFTVLLFCCLIDIYFTNGKWLHYKVNSAILIILLLLVSLIRHNGLFLCIPIILFSIFNFKAFRKKVVVISIMCGILLAFIKGPLYDYLEVRRHSNFVGEISGVPMAIMGNELINSPKTIDVKTHEFLNTLFNDEEWEKYYITGEWDSIKWSHGEVGIELLSDIEFKDIIMLTVKSIFRNPSSAFQSFSCNTRVVTQLFGEAYWNDKPYVEENEYNIVPQYGELTYKVEKYINITSLPALSFLFWNIGIYIVIFSFLGTKVIICKNYSKLLLLFPIFAYNIGTMFLLSGPSYRYFYFNVPIFAAIALILMTKKED